MDQKTTTTTCTSLWSGTVPLSWPDLKPKVTPAQLAIENNKYNMDNSIAHFIPAEVWLMVLTAGSDFTVHRNKTHVLGDPVMTKRINPDKMLLTARDIFWAFGRVCKFFNSICSGVDNAFYDMLVRANGHRGLPQFLPEQRLPAIIYLTGRHKNSPKVIMSTQAHNKTMDFIQQCIGRMLRSYEEYLDLFNENCWDWDEDTAPRIEEIKAISKDLEKDIKLVEESILAWTISEDRKRLMWLRKQITVYHDHARKIALLTKDIGVDEAAPDKTGKPAVQERLKKAAMVRQQSVMKRRVPTQQSHIVIPDTDAKPASAKKRKRPTQL
jgi:hypothetical protein